MFKNFFKNLNEKDKKKLYSLVIVAGICVVSLVLLSVFPNGSKDKEEAEEGATDENVSVSESSDQADMENKLTRILTKIEGAGDVDVMVTFESSEEIQPAYNSNQTTETTEEKDAQGGERTVTTSSENKTMITSGSSDSVVIKTIEPKIKGVIVVASGASSPKVKETLYSAVQTSLQIAGHQVEIYSK
ncbi:stage III sporulation protein AG [Metaclostridioides mangenotii]|uniref:stage III sporulation protein AG n=1 Tax=Metaclostridioides mangenotii TaxID=1540 RepID=UPI00048159EF|nr:stage III sporulation protein AG [Clostridioides mangenotii]